MVLSLVKTLLRESHQCLIGFILIFGLFHFPKCCNEKVIKKFPYWFSTLYTFLRLTIETNITYYVYLIKQILPITNN